MTNIKLTIEYDGTRYCGWQYQPNAISIQQVIEDALFDLASERIRIHGSGRTDAGVHALGQTASFTTNSIIPPVKFSHALNQNMPSDIAIVSSCEVPDDFHARFSAVGKHYKFLLFNRETRSPFYDSRAFRVNKEINVSAMKKAAVEFLGTHDFRGFMAAGSNVCDTVRTISEIFIKESEEIIEINVKGNGFLYNMVRIIAGTLLECGLGKLSSQDMTSIISSGDRDKAGPTLPAHGLYLVKVFY